MSDERLLPSVTDSDLLARIATLSPAKRALLELKLKQQRGIPPEGRTIPHRANTGAPPLSFAQQRLWFLDQFEPESAVYNVAVAFRVSGSLHIPALEQSLSEIVQRHEVLRTTFSIGEGDPVQVIAPASTLALPIVDLSARPEPVRAAEAERLIQEEGHQPFDLGRGPLLRAKVIRLGEQEHVLTLTLHHIVSDGWSLSILYRELSALYRAFSQGQPSPLPALPLQYADYAVWQRQWLQGAVLDHQLSYWKQHLENSPTLLNLPTDRPRPAAQTYRGARQAVLLPQSLVDALRELSRQQKATLYMTTMAAFQVLLYRYTGQETIVVGSPIAGRRYKETEDLIGFFVNTLAVKAELSGNPRFAELLARVRKTTLEGYDHQDIPFEKLVAELHPERTVSHSPLFQVVFAFQNVPPWTIELPGVTLTPLEIKGESAKFDLTLFLEEHGATLKATLEYNTDLFDQGTIARLLGHYQTLLAGIAAHPEQRLAELPLLTDAEHQQLFVEWNDTTRDYARDSCVHELFTAQADKNPDAIAAVFADQHLTYRELNARANQLAHYLQKLGVGPDVLVALCLERSLDLVIGLLGILKAGAAYVPLDPSHPQERLQFMLTDTKAPVLLTQQHLCDSLTPHAAHVLCLDRDWDTLSQESTENPSVQTTADHLAYVIYTSGSTGQPKGVAVPHRGIVRLVDGTDYVRFSAQEVFLHLAPISFDAATFELWGALLHGARCVLFPERTLSFTTLGHLLRTHNVSTLWLTASLFNSLIDLAPESLVGVKQLLTGGEALSVAHVRRALTLLPNTQLINGYGPTESTTFACTYAIPPDTPDTVTSISIGRPIANTQVYVLDAHLQPVPVGVVGELYIGGDGLARGYLHRPELTAEKFIPDPFSLHAGARLYKTGDLVRYLPNGTIEFLGRSDEQVKIRGFRVELGEIEAILGQHPGVQASVVIAKPGRTGDKELVAYLVPQETAPTTNEIRAYLQAKLPEYMIPAQLVYVDAVPLTPNGKVDRQTLILHKHDRTESNTEFVAPCSPLEQLLADIWREVLNVERVGVHDNFFALGGHSLLAVRVMHALEQTLGRRVAVAQLFANPTVAQLARCFAPASPAATEETLKRLCTLWEAEFATGPLDASSNFFTLGGDWMRAMRLLQRVEAEFQTTFPIATLIAGPTIGQMAQHLSNQPAPISPFLLPFHPTGTYRPFFCVWIPYQLTATLGPEQPVYGLYPHGLDGHTIPQTIEDIAADYVQTIRLVQPHGPYVLGGFCFGAMVALEMAHQLRQQGEQVAALFMFDPSTQYIQGKTRTKDLLAPSASFTNSDTLPTSSFQGLTSQRRSFSMHPQRLWQGSSRRVGKALQSLRRTTTKLRCQLYLKAGYRLPLTLREFYVDQMCFSLLRRYRPQPYSGRAIVFTVANYFTKHQPLDWLLRGAVEYYPLQGDHQEVFQEPYLRLWTPRLANVLHQITSSPGSTFTAIDKKEDSLSTFFSEKL